MPSKSPEQAKLMRAVAHGWHPDQFKGPPVSVAKEFMHADERKHKFSEGGVCYACGGRVDGHGYALGGQVEEDEGNVGLERWEREHERGSYDEEDEPEAMDEGEMRRMYAKALKRSKR